MLATCLKQLLSDAMLAQWLSKGCLVPISRQARPGHISGRINNKAFLPSPKIPHEVLEILRFARMSGDLVRPGPPFHQPRV